MSEENGPPEGVTGPQNGFQRGDTAPLNAARQASGGGAGPGHGQGAEGSGPTPPETGSQERTRPTFPPPSRHTTSAASHGTPQPGPHAPNPRAAHPPGSPHQRPHHQGQQPQAPAPGAAQGAQPQPGTARYPSQQPPHPPTAHARREPEASPLAAVAGHLRDKRDDSPGRVTPLGWVLRGLALCAISVVSGLLWLVIKPGGGDDVATDGTKPTEPSGLYRFTTKKWEQGEGNCGDVSTGEIAEYFEEHPCRHLTRALYTTTLPNGERVLTSVVTAKMANAASAARLEKLTTRNGTGNIEDLVSAGRPVPDGYPDLDGDLGYASQQQGRLVVIGESAYFRNPNRDDARLKRVTVDALRLGHAQDQRPR